MLWMQMLKAITHVVMLRMLVDGTSTSRFDVFAYFMGRHDTMPTKKQAQEAWQWVVEMSGLWLKKIVKWIVKLQLTSLSCSTSGSCFVNLWMTLASFIPSIGWAFPWSRPFLPIWVFSSLPIVLISSLGCLRCKLDLCSLSKVEWCSFNVQGQLCKETHWGSHENCIWLQHVCSLVAWFLCGFLAC